MGCISQTSSTCAFTLTSWAQWCVRLNGVLSSLCRYKAGNGELEQITSDEVLRTAIGNLEDGFRLTLWAYEKKEVNIHACIDI